jgi:hypothetical protein
MSSFTRRTVLPFPSEAGNSREQREAALTDLIADMVSMSSVLSSLLEDRMRDAGKASLSIGRRDAENIQFIANKAVAYADRVRKAWEALP